jgi:hypothetical protein
MAHDAFGHGMQSVADPAAWLEPISNWASGISTL